jgi:hypothetical protein
MKRSLISLEFLLSSFWVGDVTVIFPDRWLTAGGNGGAAVATQSRVPSIPFLQVF